MEINKCKQCKGTDFYIQEIIFHEASLFPEDKELTVYKDQAGGIERIFCKNCDKDYSEDDFKTINFR